MGLNNSFNSLGRIAGPIWAGFAFDLNYSYPYLSGAAIMFVGFLIALVWVKQEPATRRGTLPGAQQEQQRM
jgi:DHA1 family multidrug resistance protein-like MFS transporter